MGHNYMGHNDMGHSDVSPDLGANSLDRRRAVRVVPERHAAAPCARRLVERSAVVEGPHRCVNGPAAHVVDLYSYGLYSYGLYRYGLYVMAYVVMALYSYGRVDGPAAHAVDLDGAARAVGEDAHEELGLVDEQREEGDRRVRQRWAAAGPRRRAAAAVVLALGVGRRRLRGDRH